MAFLMRAPIQHRVLAALTAAGPTGLTIAEMVDTVYGDRADGGPLHAANGIAQAIHALRRNARIDTVAPRYVLGSKHGGQS
jgi:hypothetical protein